MELKNLILTQEQFSDLVGVSTRTIRTKIQGGMPSLKRKGIPFYQAFKWWMKNVVGEGEGENLYTLKIEKIKIENELKRLELLIRQGELIRREEVAQLFTDRLLIIRHGLLSLHRTLPQRLAGREFHEFGPITKRVANELLERYSRLSGPLKGGKR